MKNKHSNSNEEPANKATKLITALITHWCNGSEKDEEKFIESSEVIKENHLDNPILINLISELLFNKFQQSDSDVSSIMISVTLDNHKTRLEQLKTVNDILWKNSVAINSDRFNSTYNDMQTLHHLINNFLAITVKTKNDIRYKELLNNETLNKNIKIRITNEYLTPLEDLQRISENLILNNVNSNRGKAWTLLGYLQAFIFGNIGYIDPVHKIALKLRYVEEDIVDCEKTIYVATLHSRILGFTDKWIDNSRILEIKNSLEDLKAKRDCLNRLKAVRPANTEFITLSKDFIDFRKSLGSYTIINKQVQQLMKVTQQLENKTTAEDIEFARTMQREAEIWLDSVLTFMNRLETRFLSGYPDIIIPILSGLAQMRHGIRILVNESYRLIAVSEINISTNKLEQFLLNLIRFPTIGPEQKNILELVHFCIALDSRKLLNLCIMTENTFIILKEQFKLIIAGLYEFYNYVVIKGKLTKELWILLNSLLHQISLIWQQQQRELDKQEVEKESLYKNQIHMNGNNLTEEEQIEQELINLFPTDQEKDFGDLSNNLIPNLKIHLKKNIQKNEFGVLITKNDMEQVQHIHSNIVRSYTRCEWLFEDSNEAVPNFIEPLLQRCSTFRILLDSVRSALSNELTAKLYTSLNVLTSIAIKVGLGERLNPVNSLNFIKTNNKFYDYYKDSNIGEVKQCLPVLDGIYTKTKELLEKWPEHPTLMSLKIILQRIYSFPMSSAVSRFLTGLELVLVKMHEWEANAHSEVTLTEHILVLTQQIISWRKLELSCWKDCLTTAQRKLRSCTSKWWFFLYDLFHTYALKNNRSGERNSDEESMTLKKLIESLELFMNNSSIIEFESRLELILTFHCHAYYFNPSIQREELLSISWNIYHYYKQFLSEINNKINLIKEPIEKKLKDFVKIARWNDISYWSVKETVDKTHRTLHKFIKEFENSLREPVTPYLIVKLHSNNEFDFSNHLQNKQNLDINPNNYVVKIPKNVINNFSHIKSDLIIKADTHYLSRARKICKEIILMSSYPNLRAFFQDFIDEFRNHSVHLQGLEIDQTLPKSKQKSQAKSILQQKRMALSDYFKTLLSFGLSHRIGILMWKNKFNEITNYTIPPLNIKSALKSIEINDLEKKTLDQWDGIERYYYGSMIKLNALNQAFLTKKTDLGAQNIEWCKGFSMHLMLMANKQKKMLCSYLKYIINLKSQIFNLSNLSFDDILITKQVDLHHCANSLKEFLINACTCLQQFLIYLQACPTETQNANNDCSYNLAINELEIVNCKKGDFIWEKANSCVKDCLKIILDISTKFDRVFPELHVIYQKNLETEIQVSIITSKHFSFLKESFISLKLVKENLHQFSSMFCIEKNKHPLLENVIFLETSVTSKINEFDQIIIHSEQEAISNIYLYKDDCDKYENDLKTLVNMILIVFQDKYKTNMISDDEIKDENNHNNENLNEKIIDDEFEHNKLTEKLIESIEIDIKLLKLKKIYRILNGLLKTIFDVNSPLTLEFSRGIKKCVPLLQQYLLLVQFYLNEQVASLRITCKILYMQLNVFLDLATNGFCIPKDLDLEEGEEGLEKSGQGGMGLGEGEGQKDVSDRIETEDQLDDARPANQEKEKLENKDIPEEDKGIEMSEDFEGNLQDLENEDNDDSNDENDEDIDKEIGETDGKANKLDEQIWGDDKDEQENEEINKDDDETGDGVTAGEKEFGNKDDKTQENHENDENNKDYNKKEQQKEINEIEEPEYDEDHVNPYHGKHQLEPEPEPLDIPEEMNIDDENDKNDGQDDEENPFDIDKMKETIMPETTEPEITESKEMKDNTNNQNDDSSADENEGGNEKPTEVREDENDLNNDENKEEIHQTSETEKENKEKEETIEESEKNMDDKAMPSTDEASKEMDASKQIDERDGGSRDQVVNGTDNEQDLKEGSNAENWQDEKKDKGTGQSQAEQHNTGHSGASGQKINPILNRTIDDDKQNEKRKHPGKSDENHMLAEHIEPDKKKLKTMVHSQEKLSDDNKNDEGMELEKNNDPDICQHVKENEKFDHYAMDAATEKQSKEQTLNRNQEEEAKNNEKSTDVEMLEDEIEVIENENIPDQNPEKLSNENKSQNKNDSNEKGRIQEGQLEIAIDIQGETMDTMKVTRGAESNFFTNLNEIENVFLSTMKIEKTRIEIEKLLSQWSQIPTTEEAIAAWNTLSAITDAPARDLSEKLRLVLEPTKASRLKGDYRTGRRINMRKIIPYIASQFRKDKIWLRRTKPSKRNYQIVLAIDDSSSMADNHSKELAFESLSLISKAMTYLEAGQLSVLSFGEETNILHALGEPFNERSGSRLMQEMSFNQKKTMVSQLVDFTVDMFQSQCNSIDNAKLLVVLSDGRGVFSEGIEKVNYAVRRARLADIFLVFIIVDNPLNKDSILDIRMPVFHNGKLIGINSYMDSFPFPFYMILRDINALPGVLSDALRQWFEVVGKIDT